ncbi:MAG: tetratricopeptide repeat protein [Hyphomicrobiaceae bacterium]
MARMYLGNGSGAATVAALCALLAVGSLGASHPAFAAKDVAPQGTCDGLETGGAAWTACLTRSAVGLSNETIFYAGYWLARAGHYAEAVASLSQAQHPDSRIETYLGFAKRKSGDVAGALPHYHKALALDAENVVARAYLGEAHLALGEPGAARVQLSEIARRCGANCAAYGELAREIARYERSSG